MASLDQGLAMDEVLLSLGWWGRYQRIQFLMTMLPVLAAAFHVMSVVFIGRAVAHQCAPLDSLNILLRDADGDTQLYDVMNNHSDANVTVTYGTCTIDVKNGTNKVFSTDCVGGYKYTEPADRSFVSQWNLVCEKESLSDVSQTMLACGMMFGAGFFTALADKYGRKPVYMATHFLLFVIAVIMAFSPNFIVFVVLRFFLGSLQQGVGLTSGILLVEMLPRKRRALASQIGSFLWPGSLLVLCLLAYVTKDVSWTYTQLLAAAASVYVLFQWWITDESLRWLVANNKIEEATRIIKKAARANRADLERVMVIFRKAHESVQLKPISVIHDAIDLNSQSAVSVQQGLCEPGTDVPQQTDGMRFSAFVKNKHVLMVTLISSYMWLADSMTYYGLLMTSSALTDDLYFGFFLNVLVELPAAVAFAVLIDRIGRKRCIWIFHLVGAFSLIAATILANASFAENIPGIKTITLCISLLGKFGVSVGFAVLWLYTPELYPTNLRNTGFGISSVAARVGAMIAPYSRTFGRHIPWGPGAVFSGLCLLVPVLLRFLPETHGHELPQTIADMERWFESQRKPHKSGKSAQKI